MISESKRNAILIIGGSCSGKNTFYKKYLSKFKLIDVDEYKKQFPEKSIASAIAKMESEIKNSLTNRVDFVNITTGANFKSLNNKILKFLRFKYDVFVYHIDSDFKTNVKRNRKRFEDGIQDFVPNYKIALTITKSKNNFTILKHLYYNKHIQFFSI